MYKKTKKKGKKYDKNIYRSKQPCVGGACKKKFDELDFIEMIPSTLVPKLSEIYKKLVELIESGTAHTENAIKDAVIEIERF